MKKILSFFALAALLLTASCSKQESPVLGEDQVIISLGLEGVSATRAISDGSLVDKLVYEVYDKKGALLGTMDKTETVRFPYSLSLPLAKGQDYTILFWAQNSSCQAYNTDNLKNVTVNYTDATNNDETRDAFYAAVNVHVTGGPQKVDVVLNRPFAQVNVAVPQAEWQRAIDAGVNVSQSSVVFTQEVAKKIDLLTGNVSEYASVEYTPEAIPTEKLTVNNEDYVYLSMSYILVGKEKSMVNNATFTFNSNVNAVTLSVPNLPVQRNYRTNVLGTFLVDYVDFNIVVDPIYNTPDEVYPDTDIENLQYAAKNGGEVTLSKDVVLDEPLTISNGKSMLIDLAGRTISSEKECKASYSLIVNYGTLTIKDSKENGKITFKDLGQGGGSSFGSYVIENRGLLIIDGGTIEHQGTINALDQHNTNIPIQNYAGKVIVNKGKIVSKDFRSLRDFTAGGQIEINGGIFEGQVWMQGLGSGSTSLTITGGEFSPLAGYDGSSIYLTNGTNVINLSITGGTFATRVGCANPEKEGVKGSIKGGVYGDNTNLDKLVADGYTYAYDGEWYTVSKGERVQTVEDFRDALNDPDKDVVVLDSNLDISNETYAWLNINREVVINTENNKLEVGNSNNYGIFCNSGADVIFENVNILSNGGGIVVRDGASVEFNGNSLAIESPSTSQRYLFYAYGEGTTITINDGVFSFEQNKKRGYGYIASDATMYIKGGSFGIASNHTTDPTAPLIADGGQIIITGGTFGFNPTAWVADGYEAVPSGSTWTVKAK